MFARDAPQNCTSMINSIVWSVYFLTWSTSGRFSGNKSFSPLCMYIVLYTQLVGIIQIQISKWQHGTREGRTKIDTYGRMLFKICKLFTINRCPLGNLIWSGIRCSSMAWHVSFTILHAVERPTPNMCPILRYSMLVLINAKGWWQLGVPLILVFSCWSPILQYVDQVCWRCSQMCVSSFCKQQEKKIEWKLNYFNGNN